MLAYQHPRNMLNSICYCVSAWTTIVATVVFGLSWTQQAVAADAVNPQLQAQLDAGEFAPAFALAQQAGNRDALLGTIASAQAQSGARTASMSTASYIGNDLARSQSLQELASQPVRGAQGGGIQPDFNSLMDLIQNTVKPDSWTATGGPGAMERFPMGVLIDAQGVMRKIVKEEKSNRLADLKNLAAQDNDNQQVRSKSTLRKVSLPRLEKEVQLRLAAGRPLDEDLKVMAGLQRIEYVMIYPETGDLVIAGPAQDWTINAEGRTVGQENGHPTLQLQDLVVVLRHMMAGRDATFGCSITPTQEGLARTQEFIKQSSTKPLKEGQGPKWVKQIRDQLGRQTLEIFGGIDPQSRVAHVLLEADYHMKLIGIGLE